MIGKRKKNPVAPQFIAYYQALKVFGNFGDLSHFAEFCGISHSHLASIASGRVGMPFEVAVKAAYYSKGKLDLCDLIPFLKPYMPVLARIQLVYEMKNKSKKEILSMIEKFYLGDKNDGISLSSKIFDNFLSMQEVIADEKSDQNS